MLVFGNEVWTSTHVLVGAFLFLEVLSGNKHSLPVLKHLDRRLEQV